MLFKESVNPIREDYLSGMNLVQIGKKYGIDPRTAKRYSLKNLPTEHLQQRPFPSVLDEYKPTIHALLKTGNMPSTLIHDRLIEMGCRCGYTIVNDYVKKLSQFNKTAQANTTNNSYWKKHIKRGSFYENHMMKVNSEKSRNKEE